jgi:uncharacterized protein DUF2855
MSLDFVVGRTDLRQNAFVPGHDVDDAELAPGQALLRVDSFAFTSNNVSYGVLSDSMSYWRFFPAADGWGRLPVWGFADVIRSCHDNVPERTLFDALATSSARAYEDIQTLAESLRCPSLWRKRPPCRNQRYFQVEDGHRVTMPHSRVTVLLASVLRRRARETARMPLHRSRTFAHGRV